MGVRACGAQVTAAGGAPHHHSRATRSMRCLGRPDPFPRIEPRPSSNALGARNYQLCFLSPAATIVKSATGPPELMAKPYSPGFSGFLGVNS